MRKVAHDRAVQVTEFTRAARAWVSIGLLSLLGCGPGQPSGAAGTTQGPGDGDGDGDAAGDGDGDGDGDGAGDGDGDGDGDTAGDGDGDGDGDGATFIPTNDLGGGGFDCSEESRGGVPITPAVCDPFLQDCAGGEKCVAYGPPDGVWIANKCVEVTGDKSVGEACTTSGVCTAMDDCGQDSFCWTEHPLAVEGVCAAFCGGNARDWTCPGDGSACTRFAGGALDICLQPCDPLAQDCGPGRACFATRGWQLQSATFFCSTPVDPVGVGELTGWTTSCEPGAFLGQDLLDVCGDSECCVAYCDTDGAPCADPGTECVAWFEAETAPPGLETLGACASW